MTTRLLLATAAACAAFGAGAVAVPSRAAAPPPTVGLGTDALAWADLDGDGRPDLVTAAHSPPRVELLMSARSGYAAPETLGLGERHATGVAAISAAGGRSGRIIVPFFSSHAPVRGVAIVRRRDGALTIARIARLTQQTTNAVIGEAPSATPYAAFGAFDSNLLQLLRRPASDGAVQGLGMSPSGAVRVPTSIAVGDVDGDGVDDLASANRYGGSITVRLGRADGTFGAARESSVCRCELDAITIVAPLSAGTAASIAAGTAQRVGRVFVGRLATHGRLSWNQVMSGAGPVTALSAITGAGGRAWRLFAAYPSYGIRVRLMLGATASPARGVALPHGATHLAATAPRAPATIAAASATSAVVHLVHVAG